MKTGRNRSTHPGAGFTLVELSIASSVLLMVAVGSLSVFFVLQNTWFATSLNLTASSKVSNALTKIVYGGGSTNAGIREAEIGEATLNTGNNGSWQLSFFGTNSNEFVEYNPTTGIISNQNGFIFCDNVTASSAAFQNNGCRIEISAREIGGRKQADATLSTFVRFRN
jgi:prepilin-type N-terminal cleavage/methylation domain-containing protein